VAFFRASGNADYDLGLASDRGRLLAIVTGDSVPGTARPRLFTGISWSPDGRRLVFAGGSGEKSDARDDQTDLFVIDADGSGLERLTELGDVADPVWSPDRETVVFTRVRFGGGEPLRGGLWSVRRDGSEPPTQLVQADDWQIYTAGSFSADGSRLAVTRSTFEPDTGEKSAAVWLIAPDGSGEQMLMEQASMPAFSPDGRRIAFVSDRDRNGELCYGDRCSAANELYVASADGSSPERLTRTEDLNEVRPSWLPDGSRIAYQRGEVFQNAEAMSILEANADGTCEREILRGSGPGAWYASPAWRPARPRAGGGRLSC
jgi:dipeptidyl aminopeptidase/acylaminoacyl peptidase